MENNIAGIPIEDLKPLAIKYEGDDSFESIQKIALKISVANCARISYYTLGDNSKIDYEKDIALHDKLLQDKHMSPFEHCAKAMTDNEYEIMFQKTIPQKNHRNYFVDHIPGWCDNFRGFISYRHLIEHQ
jgi:hypothetical protein